MVMTPVPPTPATTTPQTWSRASCGTAGSGIAPTLISAFSLVERAVPSAAVTEGLTWATTGLIVGFSGSTWLAGRLVDSAGVPWAFSVASVSGALALLACRVGYRRLPT